MAKIYETLVDARRDDLKKYISNEKADMRESAIGTLFGMTVTAFAVQSDTIKKAEEILKNSNASKNLESSSTLGKWLEKLNKHSTKIAIGLAALAGVSSGISYFVHRNHKNKYEAELAKLGPGTEIIRTTDGTEIVFPDEAHVERNIQLNENADIPGTQIQAGPDAQLDGQVQKFTLQRTA